MLALRDTILSPDFLLLALIGLYAVWWLNRRGGPPRIP